LLYKLTYEFSASNDGKQKPTIITTKLNNVQKEQKPKSEDDAGPVVHLKSNEDWVRIVKETEVPLVVDCWAEWCEPCKKLDPILMEKVNKAKGAWRLVKLNIDDLPEIATSLKLRSIPTVFLIHGGAIVDGFVGMPDEKTSERFWATVDKLSAVELKENMMEENYKKAMANLEAKAYDEAIEQFKKILQDKDWVDRYGARATAALALCYVRRGDQNSSKDTLKDLISKFSSEIESKEVKDIVAEIDKEFKLLDEKSKADPKINELRQAVQKNPRDNKHRYQLAESLYESNLHEEAIGHLLDIIKIDRNWEDRKANTLILQIFGKLGSANATVIEGRKKLQKILY
jgi:putative thioredoxin